MNINNLLNSICWAAFLEMGARLENSPNPAI